MDAIRRGKEGGENRLVKTQTKLRRKTCSGQRRSVAISSAYRTSVTNNFKSSRYLQRFSSSSTRRCFSSLFLFRFSTPDIPVTDRRHYRSYRCTMVQSKKESRHKYSTTRSSICPFPRTAHYCSALLALLALGYAHVFTCFFLHSLPISWAFPNIILTEKHRLHLESPSLSSFSRFWPLLSPEPGLKVCLFCILFSDERLLLLFLFLLLCLFLLCLLLLLLFRCVLTSL